MEEPTCVHATLELDAELSKRALVVTVASVGVLMLVATLDSLDVCNIEAICLRLR